MSRYVPPKRNVVASSSGRGATARVSSGVGAAPSRRATTVGPSPSTSSTIVGRRRRRSGVDRRGVATFGYSRGPTSAMPRAMASAGRALGPSAGRAPRSTETRRPPPAIAPEAADRRGRVDEPAPDGLAVLVGPVRRDEDHPGDAGVGDGGRTRSGAIGGQPASPQLGGEGVDERRRRRRRRRPSGRWRCVARAGAAAGTHGTVQHRLVEVGDAHRTRVGAGRRPRPAPGRRRGRPAPGSIQHRLCWNGYVGRRRRRARSPRERLERSTSTPAAHCLANACSVKAVSSMSWSGWRSVGMTACGRGVDSRANDDSDWPGPSSVSTSGVSPIAVAHAVGEADRAAGVGDPVLGIVACSGVIHVPVRFDGYGIVGGRSSTAATASRQLVEHRVEQRAVGGRRQREHRARASRPLRARRPAP